MTKASADEPSPPRREAELLQSPLLIEAGFAHAFFTRRGGVSEPPWDTLNFSMAQGDAPDAVRENRRRAARALGVSERALYYLSQVHGTEATILRGDEDPEEVVRRVGDITLSSTPHVACGVRSADCVPVLLADRHTGSVAAVHSGWKGTLLGASVIGLRRLRELAAQNRRDDDADGPRTDDILAAIGPCISVCCFEVGEDVAQSLAKASSAGDSALSWGSPTARGASGLSLSTPTARDSTARTRRVDLRVIVRAQLVLAGVPDANIQDVLGCTVCDRDRFHSYRRDGERSGRLLSAIVPHSK